MFFTQKKLKQLNIAKTVQTNVFQTSTSTIQRNLMKIARKSQRKSTCCFYKYRWYHKVSVLIVLSLLFYTWICRRPVLRFVYCYFFSRYFLLLLLSMLFLSRCCSFNAFVNCYFWRIEIHSVQVRSIVW